MRKKCSHSPTGYADIEVPQGSGAGIVIPLKLCNLCLLGTPLNPNARQRFDALTKEHKDFVRDALQERHTGYDIP
jgi:hypothetical protein